MVDCKSFTKMVPMAWNQIVQQPHKSLILEEVPQDELHLCAPTVCGYSFASKKWGRFLTDKFTEIKWHENAFDHLVLSAEKKSLVESLVLADREATISDVISSKFGGFIVILYGKPGTGKTLTAEAAAERAKKPLYVLSAAELGTKSAALEHTLRNVLETCKMWDAILLIDEAEVYLEARSLGQLDRNAMVSAFLRVLEYHQQVIFLTTNHITRLDTAFKSRVSVAIKYPDLDHSAQEEIWTRFLKMAGVKICESETRCEGEASLTKAQLAELAGANMNGRYYILIRILSNVRQIKNAIRTAQATAAVKREFLNYALLKDIIDTVRDFSEFEEAGELKSTEESSSS
jgi:SpoVK/Ycf46/Vps4 family AAA+-type ATPase